MFRVIKVDGKYRLLNNRTDEVDSEVFDTMVDAVWAAEDYANSLEESAMEAGMAFGVRGYNEVRGYDSYTPEPCGHHCDWDCPQCGESY